MWRRLSQCPTSWVKVRPRLNGASTVPTVPKAVFRITTPSVALGPPGNWAYPSSPPPSVHTQMLRYSSVGHAFEPPLFARFTSSPAPNPVRCVCTRTTPSVLFPSGSVVASWNLIFGSATRPFHGAGTLEVSGFVARKSLLSAVIWLLIWARLMFSCGFL